MYHSHDTYPRWSPKCRARMSVSIRYAGSSAPTHRTNGSARTASTDSAGITAVYANDATYDVVLPPSASISSMYAPSGCVVNCTMYELLAARVIRFCGNAGAPDAGSNDPYRNPSSNEGFTTVR